MRARTRVGAGQNRLMSHRHLMPLRTRAFTAVWERVARNEISSWSPDDIAAERSKTLPTRPPATWVTGAVPDGVRATTVEVPMRDGTSIPVRVVRPRGVAVDAPVVVYFHGGGWTLSNPTNYDPLTGFLAQELGAVVVAPDYRKAPQDKAPRATHDAYDTLLWVAARPDEIAASGPIAVVGDSAGGNLAALVSILARDLDGPDLAGQALIYPAVDLTRSHPSASWRDEAILTGESIDAFVAACLDGAEVDADDPLVSPQFAASHAGLPPCLIQVAECDPLVDEGVHYARLLDDAGVPTRLTCYAGMPHGFMSFPGLTPVGRQARSELLASLRGWLTE